MAAKLQGFDADMRRVLGYHRSLVKLCRALAAIHVDTDLFEKWAPKELRNMSDNQQIRWMMEDKIRDLLRKHGDFPKKSR